METKDQTPPFLITMTEPRRIAPARGILHGAKGAPEKLMYQTEDAISHIVSAPLLYQVLYSSVESLPDLFCIQLPQILIVSQRLRAAIEPWLKDYEFIPTRIELSLADDDDETPVGGGPIVENYWWLNSWRRLDIVDWNNSQISTGKLSEDTSYPTSPVRAASRWKRLALHTPPPADEHFFGLAHIMGSQRYLSRALYEHLRAQDFKIKFEPRFLSASAWGSAYDITQELNRKP